MTSLSTPLFNTLIIRAKLLMMAESGFSLVTIALVASRAVGILS